MHTEVVALRTTADRVGAAPIEQLIELLDARLKFLKDELIPHAEREDEVLYPVVARLLGDNSATDTMRRDHTEVMQRTQELDGVCARLRTEAPDEQILADLRAALYGLHALVSVHFAKEEDVYVPMLEDRLSASEGHDLLHALHGHRPHTH